MKDSSLVGPEVIDNARNPMFSNKAQSNAFPVKEIITGKPSYITIQKF